MHNLFHWGDQINWIPIVYLGITSVAIFLVRLLTVWFFKQTYKPDLLARLQSASDTEMSEGLTELFSIFSKRRSVTPVFVSKLYLFLRAMFVAITIWAIIGTAWWMFLLGFLTWYLIHLPFRGVMLSCRDIAQAWVMFKSVSSASENVEALSKGGLTLEQEKEIQERLRIK